MMKQKNGGERSMIKPERGGRWGAKATLTKEKSTRGQLNNPDTPQNR